MGAPRGLLDGLARAHQQLGGWGLSTAQAAFAEVAHAIHASDPVTMAVSAAQFEHCRAVLDPGIRVVEMSTDDAWMRDIGPSFVLDGAGRRRGVDWVFNAWGGLDGGLYFPWDRDDQIAAKVLEVERADRYRAPFVLEGGSIHTDGEGTVLTTEECLLHPNRNPGLSREELERLLCDYLGAERALARRGRPQRRDRRPRRQPRHLHGARRRRSDLDRRPLGSPARHLGRRARAAALGAGRSGPVARGRPAPRAGAAHHHRRRGPRRRRRPGHPAADRGRPDGRLVCQLLPRRHPGRVPAARYPSRRRGRRDPRRLLPRPGGRRRRRPRDPARRGGTSTASPNRCRALPRPPGVGTRPVEGARRWAQWGGHERERIASSGSEDAGGQASRRRPWPPSAARTSASSAASRP